MIRDAELFVMAEEMLLEVLGRIRPDHRHTVLPPLLDRPGADRPTPIREAVARYAREEARVPALLAGTTVDSSGHDTAVGGLLGVDPSVTLTRIVDDACRAARSVIDGATTVHVGSGDVQAGDYLRELAVVHSFLAHDVAMALGSRACPLPEELARGLYEATEPDAERWRGAGVFRAPLPLPDGHVSWRDRFLLLAGRDPHPFPSG